MVATGWVWSRAEERVSRWHSQESAFSGEREREVQEDGAFKNARRSSESGFKSDFKGVS